MKYVNEHMELILLQSALDNVSAMVAIKNLDGVYIYANKAANDYYKEHYNKIVGLNYKDIYPESEQKIVETLDNEAIEAERPINKTIKVLTDEGYIFVESSRAPVYNESNNIIGVISVGHNVTEREEAKKQLNKTIYQLEDLTKQYHEMSYIDELTGIWNRRKFYEDFSNLKSKDNNHILIMIDVNNFKIVNDIYGHSKGDKLLKEFAQRIKTIANKNKGAAYRFGGDEFMLLYPNGIDSFKVNLQELNNFLSSYHSSSSVAYGEIVVDSNQEITENFRDKCIKRADDNLYLHKGDYKK